MAYTSREFEAGAREAFAVLIDPETYPRWLVGAQAIRSVDPTWPKQGSKFHHVVGFGPLRLTDSSEVLQIDESAMMLRLKVRARPLISAVATFRVIGTDTRCVITLEEEPASRAIGDFVRPVMDPATHVRNHRSLRRLAHVIGSVGVIVADGDADALRVGAECEIGVALVAIELSFGVVDEVELFEQHQLALVGCKLEEVVEGSDEAPRHLW